MPYQQTGARIPYLIPRVQQQIPPARDAISHEQCTTTSRAMVHAVCVAGADGSSTERHAWSARHRGRFHNCYLATAG